MMLYVLNFYDGTQFGLHKYVVFGSYKVDLITSNITSVTMHARNRWFCFFFGGGDKLKIQLQEHNQNTTTLREPSLYYMLSKTTTCFYHWN